MSLNVLERMKMNKDDSSNIILKTVKNGNLTVTNVPHILYPNGYGPDGEKEYIPGDVMYKLSKIFRYMIDNNYSEINFKKF